MRRILLISATLAGLGLGLAGCASLPMGGWFAVSVRKGDPFVIARSQSNQWGRVTHPIICALTTNRLVCRYNIIGDIRSGARSVAGADGPSYSDDGGRTWQAGDPFQWADGPPDVPTHFEAGQYYTNHYGFFWSFAAFPDGRRVAYHRDFSRPASRPLAQGYNFSNRVVWSENGGPWHGPDLVYIDSVPPKQSGVTNGYDEYANVLILPPRGVVLPDGRLVTAAYNTPHVVNFRYSTILLESTNRGASFYTKSIIAVSNDVPRGDVWGLEGPCEPGLVRLPDGELLCVMRTGVAMINQFVSKGYTLELLEARSRDDGATWTLRQLEDIRGIMPCLLQLSNGVLAMAYGRPGARVAFSTDGGHTWPRTVDLVPYGMATSGYVDMIEVSPGRILAVYDTFNRPPAKIWLWEPPKPVNTIYGVFIDVAL